jgi:pimeloyl-ACP methyl ester carboxylesterase
VAQKFAEENPVSALVLLAPVVPAETGVKPLNIPVDLSVLLPVPPFEAAKSMFLDGLDDEQARGYYSLLCPESPRFVFEAVNFCVSLDYKKFSCPILTFGAENDPLVPPDYVKAFADLTGADFHFLRGRGHNLLLEPEWRETAILIRDWLEVRHM